jgi:Ran GTPase-activating protein (RanGAP) involved in mRNA processing and transport
MGDDFFEQRSSNDWAAFCAALSECRQLKVLQLVRHHWSECAFEHWRMLCEVFSKIPLKTLELSDNHFEQECADRWVVRALLHCPQLQTLQLEGNNDVGCGAGWYALCQALLQCQQLQTLTLSDISLGRRTLDEWVAFCGALSQCQALQSLWLRNNDLNRLSPDFWMMLCRSLSRCPEFRELYFLHNNLHTFLPVDWINVGQALSQCPQLQHLSLGEEQSLQALSSDYWKALGDVVSQSPQLKSLDLQCNALYELAPEDWVALFQGLSRCHMLRSLNFRRAFIRPDNSCGLTVDSCIALSDGLSQCAHLQVLDFSENWLGASIEVWIALCRGLSQCKQLKTLNLHRNQLDNLLPHCWTALFQGLSQCEQFHTLNLKSNLNTYARSFDLVDLQRFNLEPVDPDAYSIWRELCHGLSQCTHLQTLNLCGSDINLEGWKTLCEALAQCRYLWTLDLSGIFYQNMDQYQEIFARAMPEFCGDIRMIDHDKGIFCQAMVEENRRKTKDCMVGALQFVHSQRLQQKGPEQNVLSFLFPVWQKPLLQSIDHIMEAKEKRKAGLSIV